MMVPVSAVTTQMTSANQVKKRPSRGGGGGDFFRPAGGFCWAPRRRSQAPSRSKKDPSGGGCEVGSEL